MLLAQRTRLNVYQGKPLDETRKQPFDFGRPMIEAMLAIWMRRKKVDLQRIK
jgi:hypothetical protein